MFAVHLLEMFAFPDLARSSGMGAGAPSGRLERGKGKREREKGEKNSLRAA